MDLKIMLDKLENVLIKLTQENKTDIKLMEEFPLMENDKIILVFEPKLEVGATVMIDGVIAPEGVAVIADGRAITIDAMGMVTEIKEKDEPVETTQEFNSESAINDLKNEIKELRNTLKLSIETSLKLSKEIEEVKKMPSSKPLEETNYFKTNLQLLKTK